MDWLAWVHPAGMLAVLGLGLAVLREGARLRRARLLGGGLDSRRHRRLGKSFVLLVALGWGSGLGSMTLLRGEAPLQSFHAILASASLGCVLSAGALGVGLARGAGATARTAHLLCGAAGLLGALGGAAAAFAILP
jgi:hypothetical protein